MFSGALTGSDKRDVRKCAHSAVTCLYLYDQSHDLKNFMVIFKESAFLCKVNYFLNRRRFLLLCFYTRNSFEVHLSREDIIPEKYSHHEKLVQLARTRGISSSLYLCSDRNKKKTLRHVSLLQSIFSNLSCLSFKLLGENIYADLPIECDVCYYWTVNSNLTYLSVGRSSGWFAVQCTS